MNKATLTLVATVGVLVLKASLASAEVATAAKADAMATNSMGNVARASAMQWQQSPDLPTGGKVAVVEGNPGGAELYTVRLSAPAGWTVPPHWHPGDENLTIISGTFHIAMGDKIDKTKGETLRTGDFINMHAKMHHYAWCEDDCVVQAHGIGPFMTYYVNPADDPRTKAASH